MKYKGIVAVLMLAAVPLLVFGYVSPGKPTGFVNDFAKVLTAEEKTSLENTLTNFHQQTSNEIAVVIIPTLGGDETIETYAVKLFEEWGIGGKEKDTGLLLLVAMEERKMRIEVGYGLEPYITDAQASQIIRNVLTPRFKEGQYGLGITEAVDTMIKVLGGQADAVPVDEEESKFDLGSIFFLLLFAPLWLASILGRSKSWWLGGVLGGIGGVIIGAIYGFLFIGLVATPLLIIAGLLFDLLVSRGYNSRVSKGLRPPWWAGGGRGFGGGSGGGFGGFGGGSSGGGGASGGW
jgi:uncharacterized protein